MKAFKKKIVRNRYLSWLLIVSNWCFQGIINADRTEKIYKICFSLFTAFLVYVLLHNTLFLPIHFLIMISFFIGHTINWLVNNNMYMLLVHRLGIVKLNTEDLFNYVETFSTRLNDQDWVLYVACLGSMCRGELKDTSDIDISIVRRKGFLNALKSIWFSLREKKIADFNRIPLEVFVSDTPENSLIRFSAEKIPVILKDEDDIALNYYVSVISLEQARIKNGLK